MSKKFGFGWKLAAAALAVAGAVGMAAADDVCVGTGCTAEMKVGFDIAIEDTARIEAIEVKTLDKAALLANGLTVAGDDKDKVGTLGILRITTTADAWDVKMTTRWGGKLVHEGAPTPNGTPDCPSGYDENPWNTDMCQKPGSPDVPKVEGTNPGEPKSLVYVNKSLSTAGSEPGWLNAAGTGTYDTVQLYVRIGICDLGADLNTSAGQTTYYSLGAPAAYADYPPVTITPAILTGTAKYDALDASTLIPTEASFAAILGGAYSVDLAERNLNWTTIAGGSTFATPRITPPNATDAKHLQHFYINVGMNNTVDILEKKATNGNYGETFTFELTHNLAD
ncbi:MAG: hypothetical protein LBB74_10020 [Chitinispirillales bacterium]|jgi:hypothetical protein|nr:hypothetical protein [Chitinispirillales bacterium]